MKNDDIEKKLESKNVKPTAMRTLVYKSLVDSGKAQSLSDLEQRFEKVERSTIFRTLKSFEENNLIHSIDDGTGAVRYALCDDDCTCNVDDLHIHFLCNHCGQTLCMRNLPVPQMDLPKGFTFESANFVIKGTCANCQ